MNANDALRELADVTASQWGMVTTAQAAKLGVDRLTLSRLADVGHVDRLSHGVYRDAGSPSDEFEGLRAAWLSTDPKRHAEERLRDLTDGVIVASASAARLHGVGDLWANRHEFVAAKRRQTQRTEIRYRRRALEAQDITLVGGLPAMTLERTLADLLDDVGELSLVADALSDAAKKRSLDFDRLRQLFGPLAERNGFRRHDGNALVERLMQIAGLDLDSVARKISKDTELSARILENYLKMIQMPNLSAAIKPLAPEIPDDFVHDFLEALRPQLKIKEPAWEQLAEVISKNFSTTILEVMMTLRR